MPLPIPDAGPTSVIQFAVDVAVHAKPAGKVSAIEPLLALADRARPPAGNGLLSPPTGLIVSERLTLEVALVESFTVNVGLKVPGAVGVPEKWPVESMLIPLGYPVTDQVYGGAPPLAVNKTGLYGVPTVPADSSAGLVMLSAGGGRMTKLRVVSTIGVGGDAVSCIVIWTV